MKRVRQGLFSLLQFSLVSGRRSSSSFNKHLPEVHESNSYFKTALKSASRVKFDLQVRNKLLQQKKFSLMYLNELMDGLTVPLTHILCSYRDCFNNLHPFEATVAELTIISRKKQGHRDLLVSGSHHL